MNPAPPVSLWPDPSALGALTDLYQLTMMAGYRQTGMDALPGTFELFVRRLPPHRSFLVFAGLEQAVGDLTRLAFSPQHVQWLRQLPAFRSIDDGFFDWLATLRFEGDLWAVPEGTVVFPGETLLRVEAPMAQAQWVETFLLTALSYATVVASKAARIVLAAGETRPCFEFGLRHAASGHSGIIAARAAYLAGFAGTSNVEAAYRLDIPAFGTMAHSWVQAFETETAAFETFARIFPGNTTLLVDTYDTPEGVRRACQIEPPIQAIRLDSGDLGALAIEARQILDQHGRRQTRIFASGDLNEDEITDMLQKGAPLDGFGVGTELLASRDSPTLSMVYKLVAVAGEGRVKLAPGKRTYPLAKQVYRGFDERGLMTGDHVTAADEQAEGQPLLVPVLKQGRLIGCPLPALDAIRERCKRQLAQLPAQLLDFTSTATYPVTYSQRLESEAARLGLKADPH